MTKRKACYCCLAIVALLVCSSIYSYAQTDAPDQQHDLTMMVSDFEAPWFENEDAYDVFYVRGPESGPTNPDTFEVFYVRGPERN